MQLTNLHGVSWSMPDTTYERRPKMTTEQRIAHRQERAVEAEKAVKDHVVEQKRIRENMERLRALRKA